LGLKAGVVNSPPSFEPKKGPSHEETAQNAFTMLPVEEGCSFGSLKYHGETGCLLNNLRLQQAVFFPIIFLSSIWVAYPFIVFSSLNLTFLSKLNIF
jgi:hypothetical protein